MQALEFIKAMMMANIGNTSACRNLITLEKFNCIQRITILHGLLRLDICTHPIKNVAFIKQQTEEKHGSKLYISMTAQAELISISIRKIPMNYTQPCGAGAAP